MTHKRCEPEYYGQTPLHVTVMKENIDMVKKIVETIKTLKMFHKKETESLLNHNASGLKFKNSPMLAGTPICVAALTFNQHIFNYLIYNKCDIDGVNE